MHLAWQVYYYYYYYIFAVLLIESLFLLQVFLTLLNAVLCFGYVLCFCCFYCIESTRCNTCALPSTVINFILYIYVSPEVLGNCEDRGRENQEIPRLKIKRIHRTSKVNVVPIMIGALETVSMRAIFGQHFVYVCWHTPYEFHPIVLYYG